MDASSQTIPVQEAYTVQSPSPAARLGQSFAQGAAASPSTPLSARIGHLAAADALQLLDQNQQHTGLSAVLATSSGTAARLDVSHRVDGRVEVGIVYSPLGSSLGTDTAAAMAAALRPPAAPDQAASAPAATGTGSSAAGSQQGCWMDSQQKGSEQHYGLCTSKPDSAPVADAHSSTAAYEGCNHPQQQQTNDDTSGSIAVEPSFCSGLIQCGTVAAAAAAQPAAQSMDCADGGGVAMTLRIDRSHSVPSSSNIICLATQQTAWSVQSSEAAGPDQQPQADHEKQSQQPLQLQQQSAQDEMLQQPLESLQLLPQAGSLHEVNEPLQQQQALQQGVLAVMPPAHVEQQHQQQWVGCNDADQPQQHQQLLQTQGLASENQNVHGDSSSTNSSCSSNMAATDAQMRRPRQRWRLPKVATGVTAADTSYATQGEHRMLDHSMTGSRASSGASSRCSSRAGTSQQSRGHSRQSSKSVHECSNSLDVLRSVGERVQGLLEALSRQTSGGGARCSSDPAPTAQAAAADYTKVSPCSTSTERESTVNMEQHSSDAHRQKHTQQLQQQQQAAMTPAASDAGSPAAGVCLTSADTAACYGVTLVAGVQGEGNSPPCQAAHAAAQQSQDNIVGWQQAVEQLQAAAEVQQGPQLQPLATSTPSGIADAGHTTSAGGDDAGSLPSDAEEIEGFAQVQEALQKLHSLRSTLQRIAGSGPSSMQTSHRDSAVPSGEASCDQATWLVSAACADSKGVAEAASTAAAAEGSAGGVQASVQQLLQEERKKVALLPVVTAGDVWVQQGMQHIRGAGTSAHVEPPDNDNNRTTTSTDAVPSTALHLQQQVVQQQQQQHVGLEDQHAVAWTPSGVMSSLEGLQSVDWVQKAAAMRTASSWVEGAATTLDTGLPVNTVVAEQSPAGGELLILATEPEQDFGVLGSCWTGPDESTATAAAVPAVDGGEAAGYGVSTATAVQQYPDGPADLRQGVSTLQRMLDASSDTALLMSLACKLDSLAKRFKRQVSFCLLCC